MDLLSSLAAACGLMVLLTACWLLWMVINISWTHAKYSHIPGPKRSSFFLGNLDQINKLARQGEDTMVLPSDGRKLKPLLPQLLEQWANEYGDVFVIFMLTRPIVIVRSPNSVKAVLNSPDKELFEQDHIFNFKSVFGKRMLGESLFTVKDYTEWKTKRGSLHHTFNHRQLTNSIEAHNTAGDKLVDELKAYAESGDSLTMESFLHNTTVDVIMKTLFSVESTDLHSDFHQITYSFVRDIGEAIQLSSNPLFRLNPFGQSYRNFTRAKIEQFRSFGARMIKERINQIQAGDDVPEDMLSTMVQSYLHTDDGTFDFEAMVDEFVSMIAAGMGTTGCTLEFILMELGRRPALTKRLQDEIDEVVGERTKVTSEDLSKLHFMTTVIKETLRLYPVSMIFRKTTSDTSLDDFYIPKNTTVMINILAVNHHPEHIEDPLTFDPDRFDINKSHKAVTYYSNIPFSAGPRNCIGQTFAQMEIKVLLVKVFQNYKFKLDPSETFELGQRVLMSPISGVKCTITTRE